MTDSAGLPLGGFLTVADVADVLNVTATEVLSLVRAGELPAIHLGSIGQWRIDPAVLESFIADKYDESRRMGLWHEAQLADVADLFGERRRSSRGA